MAHKLTDKYLKPRQASQVAILGGLLVATALTLRSLPAIWAVLFRCGRGAGKSEAMLAS